MSPLTQNQLVESWIHILFLDSLLPALLPARCLGHSSNHKPAAEVVNVITHYNRPEWGVSPGGVTEREVVCILAAVCLELDRAQWRGSSIRIGASGSE